MGRSRAQGGREEEYGEILVPPTSRCGRHGNEGPVRRDGVGDGGGGVAGTEAVGDWARQALGEGITPVVAGGVARCGAARFGGGIPQLQVREPS